MVTINRVDGISAMDRSLRGRYVANRDGRKCQIKGVWVGTIGCAICEMADVETGEISREFLMSVVQNNRYGNEFGRVWHDMVSDMVLGFDIWGEV